MAQYYAGTGKRKTAIAQVRLMPGAGKVTVNGKDFQQVFLRDEHRRQIQAPFQATETAGKYDVTAKVTGGGLTGQAGAIRHGITRALLTIKDEFREVLKKAGLITRDSRVKERKKYGQKGARKRFQYSKR